MAVDTVPAAVPDPANHPPAAPADGTRQGTGSSLFAAIDPVRPAPDFDLTPASAAANQGVDETATGNGSSASYHDDENTSSSGNTGSRNSIQKQSVWRAWLLAGATRWGKGGGATNKRLDLAKVKAQRRQVKENRQVSINRSGGLLGNRPGGSGGPGASGSAGGGGKSGGGKSLNSKNSGGGAPKGPKNSNGSAHQGSSGRSGGSGGSGSHGGGGRGPGGFGGGSHGASGARGSDGKAPKGPKSSKDRSGGGSGGGKSPKSGGGASPSGGRSSGPSGSGKSGNAGGQGSAGGAGKSGSSGGGAAKSGGKDADTGSGSGSGKVNLKKSGKGGKGDSKDATGSGNADGKHDGHGKKPDEKTGKDAAADGKSSAPGKPGTPGTPGTTPADKNGKPSKGSNGDRTDQPKDSNGKPLNTKESREAGYRDGSRAAQTVAHVKAYKDGVKDGWDDTTAAAKREKKQLDKTHQNRKKAREGEQDVTTPASSADYHQPEPIGVTKVTEDNVFLDGAAKGSITRGETRSLKDYEYKIRAKVDSMQKIAEVTRALKQHAQEQAGEVTKLAEGAKSVKGGDKLIGALTKLAEDAAAQVTKAEEIHKQAVRAADGCTTVLSNVETRYGGLYKAVIDSGLATMAEVNFLKG